VYVTSHEENTHLFSEGGEFKKGMKVKTDAPLELNKRFTLKLSEDTGQCLGDSLGLQKGLIMFLGSEPLCGEGVGFGVPAVEYSNQILFSRTATMIKKNSEFVKTFSIDAVQRKTWKDKFSLDNKIYRSVQSILADAYRTKAEFRPALGHIMRIQSLVGIKLSTKSVESKGYVNQTYRMSGNSVTITVDNSGLTDKDFTRLYIFNEQSSDFDVYHDEFGTLRDDDIGVWEEVRSRRAYLTNRKLNVTFGVGNIPGTKLYRGRELLRPRLDWAGFCYSVPSNIQRFSYTVQIS
jgi:hypothetical protein